MRAALATVAALAAFAASAASPAEARTGDDYWTEIMRGDRGEAYQSTERPAPGRRKSARATINDTDEQYEVEDTRPRRTYRGERRVKTKRYGVRTKHARTKQGRSGRNVSRYNNRASQGRSKHARLPVHGHRVQARATGTTQQGIASYYWQGQRLATGGWFNPDGISAAHRTLPFGTRVRVTHLSNGRTVDVRINDRGPYIAGRIIDRSRGAARIIGMTGQGIAQVRVTVLGR